MLISSPYVIVYFGINMPENPYLVVTYFVVMCGIVIFGITLIAFGLVQRGIV